MIRTAFAAIIAHTALALPGLTLSARADILVNLTPDTAAADTADTRDREQTVRVGPPVDGVTINVTFTPAEADLAGTVLLAEIGGTSNGTGLYLIDGVPTVVSKQNATATAAPAGTTDSDLSDDTMSVPAPAKLTAGTTYSVAAILHFAGDPEESDSKAGAPPHAATATLAVDPGGTGQHITRTTTELTDPTTNGINWAGNRTVSVRTRPADANLGGLSYTPGPFAAKTCRSLAGTVARALIWSSDSSVYDRTGKP